MQRDTRYIFASKTMAFAVMQTCWRGSALEGERTRCCWPAAQGVDVVCRCWNALQQHVEMHVAALVMHTSSDQEQRPSQLHIHSP